MMAVMLLVAGSQGEQQMEAIIYSTRTVQMDGCGFNPIFILCYLLPICWKEVLNVFHAHFMPISLYHVSSFFVSSPRSFVSLPRVCRRAPSNALGIRTGSHLKPVHSRKMLEQICMEHKYYLIASAHVVALDYSIFMHLLPFSGMHTCDSPGTLSTSTLPFPTSAAHDVPRKLPGPLARHGWEQRCHPPGR